MVAINQVSLAGNLTRDPELRYTAQGNAVCEFTVAVNEKWGSGDQRREEVHFFECVAWRRAAEIIAEYLRKGSPVWVSGKLKQDRWEDQNSGQKRSKVRVTVREFQFLGGKSNGQQGAARGEPSAEEVGEDFPF